MSSNIYIDASAITKIQKGLGEFQSKTPQVLKNAVNETAKQMRKLMIERAQKVYTVKSRRFNKATTIKNATTRNFTAVITSKGSPMELKDFKVSPAKPQTEPNPRGKTKAKVYNSSQMKSLERNGIKAFVTQFKNGHISVAQRRTKARLPIKVLYSTSIPHMVGNENEVFKLIIPEVHKVYGEQISTQMQKMIDRIRRTS